MLHWDRQEVITFLTMVIVGVWIVTAVVRIWVSWPAAYVLDAAMPLVVGYWFVSNAVKKNGNGVPAA
jgi:hypothetical protein